MLFRGGPRSAGLLEVACVQRDQLVVVVVHYSTFQAFDLLCERLKTPNLANCYIQLILSRKATYPGLFMLIATLILLIGVAARELYLEHWLHHSARIKTIRRGWLAVEVRRRVRMERLPDHVCEYPVPREERILVNRVLGLVLWHREVSVALPASACEHLDEVTPQEFDRQFPPWLRLVGGTN